MPQYKYKLKSSLIDHDIKIAKYSVDVLLYLMNKSDTRKNIFSLEVYKTDSDSESAMFGAKVDLGDEKEFNDLHALLENKGGDLRIGCEVQGNQCRMDFKRNLILHKEAGGMEIISTGNLIEYLLDKQHNEVANAYSKILKGTQAKSEVHGYTQTDKIPNIDKPSQTPIVEKASVHTQHEDQDGGTEGNLVKIHSKKAPTKDLDVEGHDYEIKLAPVNKIEEISEASGENTLEGHKYSRDALKEIRQVVNEKSLASDFHNKHVPTLSKLGISIVNPAAQRFRRHGDNHEHDGESHLTADISSNSEKENIKPEVTSKPDDFGEHILSPPISQESFETFKPPIDLKEPAKSLHALPEEELSNKTGGEQKEHEWKDIVSEHSSVDRSRQSSGFSQASGASARGGTYRYGAGGKGLFARRESDSSIDDGPRGFKHNTYGEDTVYGGLGGRGQSFRGGRGGFKSDHNQGYEERISSSAKKLDYIPYGDPSLVLGADSAQSPSSNQGEVQKESFGETRGSSFGSNASFPQSTHGRGGSRGGSFGSYGSISDQGQESGRGGRGSSFGSRYQPETGGFRGGRGSGYGSNTGQDFGNQDFGRGASRGSFGDRSNTSFQQETYGRGGRGVGRGGFGSFSDNQDSDDTGFARGGFGARGGSSYRGRRGGFQSHQQVQVSSASINQDEWGSPTPIHPVTQEEENHDGEW